MGLFFVYILKSSVCLAIFYLFYRLLLARETARLFTDFGFAGLHLHRISLRVLAENTAARRSYEKAGFVQEGVFRDMELLDGAYRDVVFMAKLAEN